MAAVAAAIYGAAALALPGDVVVISDKRSRPTRRRRFII